MIGYSTVTQKGQVTIPAKIRKAAGLKQNRKVIITLENNVATITPVKDIFELFGSVKSSGPPPTKKQMREAFIEYLSYRKR